MSREPTRRARGRPKTFDRDRTLDVAIDGYWREGVDAVSVNEICRRAGVSKPGLYREFGNEDLLLDAVLDRYFDTVLGPTLAILAEDRPFPQTLAAMIEFATRPATSDIPPGCLFAKMRAARGTLGPTTGAHVDRLREHLVTMYSEWLAACAERGEITLPASLETTAGYVDTQLTLIVTRMAAGDDPRTVREHARLAFAILAAPAGPA